MKTYAAGFVAALMLCLAFFASAAPASADTAYLTLAGANPYNGPCPATLSFSGHIDGAPGSMVTYFFARQRAGVNSGSAPVTASIPASGSLPIVSNLVLDASQAGLQSYGFQITSPNNNDTTHGTVFFTVNCLAQPAPVSPVSPQPLRPVILIPVDAGMAYFQDHTGFNPLCIPWPLPHPGYVPTDFGGSVAVGYTHYQHGGPNGDPCGVHNDDIYRIMVKAVVPPIRGRLSSVVLTATHTGTDANTVCKLGQMVRVNGVFNTGNVGGPSGFSPGVGLDMYSSSQTDVNYQIYPLTGGGPVAAATNAAQAAAFAAGGTMQYMLIGTDEHIDRDNLHCLLKYQNFKLNIIAG